MRTKPLHLGAEQLVKLVVYPDRCGLRERAEY